MAQLDRLEALNAPVRSDRLGGAATWLALVGGVVVLMGATMLRTDNKAVPTAASPVVAVAEAVPVNTAAPQSSPPAEPAAVAAAAVAASTEPTVAVAAAPVAPSADDASAAIGAGLSSDPVAAEAAARRARALAERRKAAQLAQERAAAEETARLELVAARRAEEQRAAAEERERIAAAETARRAAVAPAPAVVAAVRRGVRDTCSGSGGFFAENACRVRECAQPEARDDAVCVRLREIEESRRSASLYR